MTSSPIDALKWKVLSSYKANRIRTWTYQQLAPCTHPRIVWVFGCQRSGTTMLRSFIGFDPRVNDQGEGDPPFFHQTTNDHPDYIRLIDDDQIEALVKEQRSEMVLIKPLHDSQRAAALLDRFPDSKGVWIFRNFHEVILSHLTYYEGRYEGLSYVRPLLDLASNSWKAENLSNEMREQIKQFRKLVDTPTAAFAVFWLARNSLYFSQPHSNLIALDYKQLVQQPSECLATLSRHIYLDLDPRYAQFPEHRDRTKPLPNEIPPPILEACEAMTLKLQSASSLHGVD